MSETFYIKKTAFDDNNFDLTQRETDSFIIGPGELNGPGGIEPRASDLELYGFGSLKWGEGVDQNQYRLMESSACPAKVDGDYYDGIIPFEVATHGIVPKSEEDLGIGNGITKPLVGQLWYNTSAILLGGEILYTFTTTNTWLSSHTLVADLDLSGNTITNLGDPDFLANTLPGSVSTENKQDALTVGWSDDRYVNQTGDSMVGTLTITDTTALTLTGAMGLTGNLTMVGDLSLTDNDELSLGDSGDLTLSHIASQSFITNATGDLIIINNGANIRIDSSTVSSVISLYTGGSLAASFGGASVDAILYFGNSEKLRTVSAGVEVQGSVRVTTLTPPTVNHLASKSYVDLRALRDSDTLTGTPEAPTPPTGDSSTRIATTAFVQAQVSTVGKVTESDTLSGSVTVPAGINVVDITIIGAGGGGAAGGDGGDFTGDTGNTGGSSSVTVPGHSTVTVRGGRGGLGTQNANNHTWVSRGEAGGYGSSTRGGRGYAGDPGKGGDGGGSEVGYAGIGATSPATWGQNGSRGGGGGGGWGQDNAAGNGGDSGNLYRKIFSCTAGTTITWTLGLGGIGGVNSTGSARWGGTGGRGYIIITWSST